VCLLPVFQADAVHGCCFFDSAVTVVLLVASIRC
jgi:hypothetical protein